ncbi:hypothetical protein CKA32_003580 [Geitlerinema sp. FC II]|nr:phycobiliprotein lyase [Geitlerinema sp. CS-897]PPT05502.1 hypothetical protein CKA32_003580 [Geitlerinema sp. FC II]
MELDRFQAFFDCCVGSWSTERTYHYIERQEVERSHTDFVIDAIPNDLKTKVLEDNTYSVPENLDPLPGYHLEFDTISETGEEVSQQLNLLFVPQTQTGKFIEGDYLRDRAYEEDRPIISSFRFDTETRELLMTTNYTRVVAVDSITLINPTLRVRQILSYERPPEGQPLERVVLVGFGVEQKN